LESELFFSSTYQKVNDKAKMHQAWQHCVLMMEFLMHIPPPFSIVTNVIFAVGYYGLKGLGECLSMCGT
jgi:hypothetical protein